MQDYREKPVDNSPLHDGPLYDDPLYAPDNVAVHYQAPLDPPSSKRKMDNRSQDRLKSDGSLTPVRDTVRKMASASY